MGKLRNQKVAPIRTYIDPSNPTAIPSLDYDIIYPETVYSAIRRTMEADSTTLDSELEAIYRLIAEKQDQLYGGTPGTLMSWTTNPGEVGSIEIAKTIPSDSSARSYQKIASEKAVGTALDLKADASSFNKHDTDNVRHITEAERDKWNEMTPLDSFRQHTNDIKIHITDEERKSWNAKANQVDFESHLMANNPHGVTAHQVNAYTRSEVDELFDNIRESFFNYRNIKYDSRKNIATLVEYQAEYWNPNYILGYGDELPTVADGTLTYFALKPVTDYTVNETQDCIIYMKAPGLKWQEVGVQTMNPGDMVIRYPDTTMCVWVQGRFISLFTSSSSIGEGSVGTSNGVMWRPVLSSDGVLSWTKSSESEPPSPMSISGRPGYTPVKGVDYFDGANGIGVPTGGNPGDIMFKTSSDDYEVQWTSFKDFLDDYVAKGGTVPGTVVDWKNVENKPTIYNSTGSDTNGLMSQKAISDQFRSVADQIAAILNEIGSSSGLGGLSAKLAEHEANTNNPHHVTVEQLGAISMEAFLKHTQNHSNPHSVTAAQIGLGNVNNTSDMNKPISIAVENALNAIRRRIEEVATEINGSQMVSQVSWNDANCTLTFLFKDESELDVKIPIIEIFSQMYYDDTNNELVIVLPNGDEHRISIGSLITVYRGGRSVNIDTKIEGGLVKSTLIPNSVTGDDLQKDIILIGSPSTTTQLPSDKSDKIATTKFVKNTVVDNLISYDADRPLSANMGRLLNSSKVSITEVLQIIADSPMMNVVDSLYSDDPYAALSANMGNYLNRTKAPFVHTSPSGSTFGRASVSLFGHARASDVDPLMDGTSFIGTDDGYYARADHRHPTDTSRAPLHWPDIDRGQYRFTGEPRSTLPPDGDMSDWIATTEWVYRNPGFDTLKVEEIDEIVANVWSVIELNSDQIASLYGTYMEYGQLILVIPDNESVEIFINGDGDLIMVVPDTETNATKVLQNYRYSITNDGILKVEIAG